MTNVEKQRPIRRKLLTAVSLLPDVINNVLALERKLDEVDSISTKNKDAIKTSEERLTTAEGRLKTCEDVGRETARLLTLLTERVETLVDPIDTLNATVKRTCDSVTAMAVKVNKHEESYSKMENADTNRTLLIEGLTEPQGRENLRQLMDDLSTDLGLNYNNDKVETIYRLGKVPTNRPDFKRPIVVKLTARSIKGEIFKNVRNLNVNVVNIMLRFMVLNVQKKNIC